MIHHDNEVPKPPCVYANTCNCTSPDNCLWLAEQAGIEAARAKGRTDSADLAKEIAKMSLIRFAAKHLADKYDDIFDWLEKICRHHH